MAGRAVGSEVSEGGLRRFLLGPWLTIRVQLALGAVFVAAAIPKISDPPSFAHMIYNYRLLPGVVVNPFALVLPWIELLAGLCLVLGLYRRTSAELAGLLLVVFLLAIGTNLARTNPVQCGCFDVHAAGKPKAELLSEMRGVLLRDTGLLLLAGQLLVALRPGREIE
jgi:uncharacterized membrane protein YphA (DoxX/SURF4 family)